MAAYQPYLSYCAQDVAAVAFVGAAGAALFLLVPNHLLVRAQIH